MNLTFLIVAIILLNPVLSTLKPHFAFYNWFLHNRPQFDGAYLPKLVTRKSEYGHHYHTIIHISQLPNYLNMFHTWEYNTGYYKKTIKFAPGKNFDNLRWGREYEKIVYTKQINPVGGGISEMQLFAYHGVKDGDELNLYSTHAIDSVLTVQQYNPRWVRRCKRSWKRGWRKKCWWEIVYDPRNLHSGEMNHVKIYLTSFLHFEAYRKFPVLYGPLTGIPNTKFFLGSQTGNGERQVLYRVQAYDAFYAIMNMVGEGIFEYNDQIDGILNSGENGELMVGKNKDWKVNIHNYGNGYCDLIVSKGV